MAKGMARERRREELQGIIHAYVHHSLRLGVLLDLGCDTDFVARTEEFRTLAHEIAMQIAATEPRYIALDEIPASDVAEMKERFRQEAGAEHLPEHAVEAVAEGRFRRYAQTAVILEQPSIRDGSVTIGQMVEEVAARAREIITIRRFSRFQMGPIPDDEPADPTDDEPPAPGGDEPPPTAPVPAPPRPPHLSSHDAAEIPES